MHINLGIQRQGVSTQNVGARKDGLFPQNPFKQGPLRIEHDAHHCRSLFIATR